VISRPADSTLSSVLTAGKTLDEGVKVNFFRCRTFDAGDIKHCGAHQSGLVMPIGTPEAIAKGWEWFIDIRLFVVPFIGNNVSRRDGIRDNVPDFDIGRKL
jgi:hypothetical protein